jgi:hypothetical protein
LNRIEFEESADDNDIGVQDFYFGYLPSMQPLIFR